jgi:hypothetical protein
MLLKDIIKAPKNVTDNGVWTSGVLMPKSQFPLLGNHKLVRKPFTWKVIKFSCLGKNFRLIIFYRLDRQTYYAWLGFDTSPVTVIARYEYHSTHPGWHIHSCCDTEHAIQGVFNKKALNTRLPGGYSKHRNAEFGITTSIDAELKANKMFGIGGMETSIVRDLFTQ